MWLDPQARPDVNLALLLVWSCCPTVVPFYGAILIARLARRIEEYRWRKFWEKKNASYRHPE